MFNFLKEFFKQSWYYNLNNKMRDSYINYCLLFLNIFNVGDLITTLYYYFLKRNFDYEYNTVLRYIFDYFNIYGVIFFKIFFVLLVTIILYYAYKKIILLKIYIFLIAFYLCLVLLTCIISNIIVIMQV